MLLVIPRIDMRDGLCEYAPTAVGRHLLRDPVAMSRLWRIQNAKTLVLADLPTRNENSPDLNLPVIEAVCNQLDIPIQVDCSRNPTADLDQLLAHGAYRVIVGDDADPSEMADLSASGQNRRFAVRMNLESTARTAEKIRRYDSAGCQRFVVNVLPGEEPIREAFSRLLELATLAPDARFSVDGAVTDYPGLRIFEDGAPVNVDSVILGKPLYENRFPCQMTWCWNWPDAPALDEYTTATLRDKPRA